MAMMHKLIGSFEQSQIHRVGEQNTLIEGRTIAC